MEFHSFNKLNLPPPMDGKWYVLWTEIPCDDNAHPAYIGRWSGERFYDDKGSVVSDDRIISYSYLPQTTQEMKEASLNQNYYDEIIDTHFVDGVKLRTGLSC